MVTGLLRGNEALQELINSSQTSQTDGFFFLIFISHFTFPDYHPLWGIMQDHNEIISLRKIFQL